MRPRWTCVEGLPDKDETQSLFATHNNQTNKSLFVLMGTYHFQQCCLLYLIREARNNEELDAHIADRLRLLPASLHYQRQSCFLVYLPAVMNMHAGGHQVSIFIIAQVYLVT